MPRFDFLCAACNETFEHLLPMGGAPPKCLKCGSKKVEKLLSPPPVIFKGSGFYKTDSGKKSEATGNPIKAPESHNPEKESTGKNGEKAQKSGEEKPKSGEKKSLAKGGEDS